LDRSQLLHEQARLDAKLDALRHFTRVRGFDIKIVTRDGGWAILNVGPDEP
jgi:hypothetical protein